VDDGVGRRVKHEAGIAGRVVRTRPAAAQRVDAHKQFRQRERLREVVVAAGVKAAQPV
jgi:hypothetical protein